MEFQETRFKGVYIVNTQPRYDNRGYFMRIYCSDEFSKYAQLFSIVQVNQSLSKKKGTIRGLHYQNSPFEEDKYIQCVQGSIFDVVIDLRKDSETYQKWFGIILKATDSILLFVSKGFAHGYQALEDNTVVQYSTSQKYRPDHENGIRWNDPNFSIEWPIQIPIISSKDALWKTFNQE